MLDVGGVYKCNFCVVFHQMPLAPPDVQQQYLSSIQHLLGDGNDNYSAF